MIARWLFKQFMRFQIFMYRRSGGKRFGRVRGMPVLLLTTVGRKTSLRHVRPVMYIRDGDTYVVTASYAGLDRQPAWFLNLKANAQVMIEVDSLTQSATARQASPEQRARLWPQLVRQAPFFDDYQKHTQREIPMVILQPTGDKQPAN